MIVLTIILFIIFVFLMYYGYLLISDKPFPEFWKNIGKKTKKNNIVKPTPNSNALGYCTFEGEDLYNKDVYTFDGKKVSVDVSPIKCSDCNQYIFKDDTGCVSYIYDMIANTNIDDSIHLDNFCDPAHPERNNTCIKPHGVCTPSMAPSSTCLF